LRRAGVSGSPTGATTRSPSCAAASTITR
jgi:hypothetical protein